MLREKDETSLTEEIRINRSFTSLLGVEYPDHQIDQDSTSKTKRKITRTPQYISKLSTDIMAPNLMLPPNCRYAEEKLGSLWKIFRGGSGKGRCRCQKWAVICQGSKEAQRATLHNLWSGQRQDPARICRRKEACPATSSWGRTCIKSHSSSWQRLWHIQETAHD